MPFKIRSGKSKAETKSGQFWEGSRGGQGRGGMIALKVIERNGDGKCGFYLLETYLDGRGATWCGSIWRGW
jgi:streptomycin 6-kinase